MSTISNIRPAVNPGNICQTCDTKLACAQCTNANVMNNELATLKNEIKQLRKHATYSWIATLVVVTSVLLASSSLYGSSFTNTSKNCSNIDNVTITREESNTSTSILSPKNSFATGKGLETAVVGERELMQFFIQSIRKGKDTTYKQR